MTTTGRFIIWKGNHYTNWNERMDDDGRAYIPLAIVNHISAGTMRSMDNWFTDPGNEKSSAHFGVGKDGSIHQYVDIRKMAWANGAIVDTYAPAGKLAQIVADHYGVNPNLYTVSIEHEGTDGTLTEAQFAASVWLHGYIRDQIAEIYGEAFWFDLDAYHVIGHYQVSRLKPSCPGPNFPWSRLYQQLQEDGANMNKVSQLEQRITELQAEIKALKDKETLPPPKWAEKAVAAAIEAGLLDTDVPVRGSYDFYRFLTIQHRAGKL